MLLLAADRRPLAPGQIVYGMHDGTPWHVEHVKHFSMSDEMVVIVSDAHGVLRTLSADEVTHEISSDAKGDETAGNVCGDCEHFMGFGDFDLCCAIQARRLASADTTACNSFEPKTLNG